MMTQEEIDAILGEDTHQSSVEVVSLPEEEDDPMEGNPLDIIKDVPTAVRYLNKKKLCPELLKEYELSLDGSYIQKVAAYRIVVAALTVNEERHLVKGDRWYPLIQFCKPGKEKNCWGSKVIGTIESEGETFTVVGGYAYSSGHAGLGYFYSSLGVSSSHSSMGFRSVSSERVAKYISEQFGRLLFEVHYGGTNCNWRWQS